MSRRRLSSLLLPAIGLSVSVLAVALVFVFSRSMQRDLDHDEHQFVAGATLFAREGLLPYRDFPHFHMPYLVFVYGWLQGLSDQLLFGARLVSVASAWGALLLLHQLVLRAAGRSSPLARHALACAAVLLLLFNPLFTYTSGLAWNHDLSVLLSLGALVALSHSRGARGWVLAAGICLGLAVGVRLSVAPLVLPFLLVGWNCAPAPNRVRHAVLFTSGLGLALLPAAWLAWIAPSEMLFGNLIYPGLNTAFRTASGFSGAMDLSAKVGFATVEVLAQPANALLLALLIYGCWCSPLHVGSRDGRQRVLGLALLPFAILGAFTATPSWLQYFYAAVPPAILCAVLGLAAAPARSLKRQIGSVLICFAVVAGVTTTLPEYRTLSNLPHPGSWTPQRTHTAGITLVQRSGPGRVLTLAPLYPLEGGAEIDPAFVGGPFAWRTAVHLAADERAAQHMVGPDELDAYLRGREPVAVLTGTESSGEDPLRTWAQERAYEMTRLDTGRKQLILQLAPGDS